MVAPSAPPEAAIWVLACVENLAVCCLVTRAFCDICAEEAFPAILLAFKALL
jgi:hypothetical protein